MAIIVILIAGLLFMIKFFKIKIMEPAGLYSIMWIVFYCWKYFIFKGRI